MYITLIRTFGYFTGIPYRDVGIATDPGYNISENQAIFPMISYYNTLEKQEKRVIFRFRTSKGSGTTSSIIDLDRVPDQIK